MRIAMAYLAKDRCDLTKRTLTRLVRAPGEKPLYDVWVFDGSDTPAGIELAERFYDLPVSFDVRTNIKGGADTAVVYALTFLLEKGYDYIGLCESDVLLPKDWFGSTFALFERGKAEGLEVGAVSARCYVDRILCQREGYALLINNGWGTQLMTRQAAELTLKHMRTPFTSEIRRTFARLSGIDVGSYFAFRAGEHYCTPDWQDATVLAAHGLASLALVPSPVQMIGQVPSLAEQGLKLADSPIEDRRNDDAFDRFATMTSLIREGKLDLGIPPIRYRADDGTETVFAHQLDSLRGAFWSGDWRLKWSPGLGGFAARGFPNATFEAHISGTARFMVGGGEKGGQVAIEDLKSGYVVRPTLLPEASNQVTQVVAPAAVSWRAVRLTVLSGNAVFYGITCQEPQPVVTASGGFDHSKLWPV